MTDYSNITEALIKGDESAVLGAVNAALNAGDAAGEVLNQGLISGMDVVWHSLKFLGKEDIELKKFVEIDE